MEFSGKRSTHHVRQQNDLNSQASMVTTPVQTVHLVNTDTVHDAFNSIIEQQSSILNTTITAPNSMHANVRII